MAGFLIAVILLGWAVSWYFGNSYILYGAVIFALLMNVFSYWYSDKVVIKMTGAKEATGPEYRELNRIVENLAITAGLPKPKVYVVEDPSPNAFATGRDPEHAVVAVTTGLMRILDKTELEGVVAHELAHIGNRDMLVMTVAVVLAGFVAIVADIFLRMSLFGGGNSDDNRAGAIAVIFLIIGAILAPVAAQLIQLAISRKREFLADASGALLTRYPEGLASALEKISQHSQPMKRANHATAHLFIANPFGPKAGQFVNKLFSSHPPVEDRLQALRNKG